MYLHGLTYGGNPSACAAGLANLAIMEREDVLGNVRHNEDYFRTRMEDLGSLALVGDVRGAGYHWTLELATDKEKRTWAGPVNAAEFVSEHLAPGLLSAGVLCRAAVDQGGAPLIQFSPPLILNRDEIDWLVASVAAVLKASEAALAGTGA
jgi:adenosylmethionine-8-amino-7-oxononanoate aminotransferase